ncbi:cytochrome P450 [Streptomyces sp. BE147]|uniref:cytochrome P450 n=1 Tax=Streptomyces sp. BE147 TaxID=3002524 RepID=UPI002E7980DB|nr:cytochrome P450 [Streptomyces sp. BE147]MEE1737876.1 cytochrome P450 [Streptomyces sp. BE147]
MPKTSDPQEILELLDTPEGRDNPYPLYDLLRQHPPMYDERHKATLLVNYTDCVAALSGRGFRRPDDTWLKRRIPGWAEHPSVVGFARMMQFGDSMSHPRRRGVVNRFFSKRRITALVTSEAAVVDVLLDDLVRDITDQGEADIQDGLSYRLPSISIAGLLGLPEDEVAGFRPHTLAFANLLEPDLPAYLLSEADRSFLELEEYFEQVIGDRRRHPHDDLASYLVHVHDSDPDVLSRDELTAMFVSVFVAGTMNTSSFLGNGTAALLHAPQAAARLRDDPSLTPAAVTEMLRYDAPMQVTRRMATEDMELSGRRIAADTELAVVLGAANRDPAVYRDPHMFVLNRTDPAPISFGGGAYFCIGSAMAQQEGVLIFDKLLARLPALRAGSSPEHNLRSVLRGYLHLPVTTKPPTAAT